MRPLLKWTALTLAICLPLSAQAHRAWLLPSATVLSGDTPWVTVDAAVSNDLFYFEHFPLQLQGIGQSPSQGNGQAAPMRRNPAKLLISAPDGTELAPQNGNIGRYRTSFDVELAQKGTYKLSVANAGLMAMWKEGGEMRRWMGKAEELGQAIPENAEDVRVIQSNNRMETFVTSGQPTTEVLATTGVGLELQAITHPNDLFAGESAEFVLLLDGQPAADVEVVVIPGGNRYRDQTGEINLKTDAKGQLSITWPEAGMYWLEAELSTKQGVARPATERRAVYSATFEVLAP